MVQDLLIPGSMYDAPHLGGAKNHAMIRDIQNTINGIERSFFFSFQEGNFMKKLWLFAVAVLTLCALMNTAYAQLGTANLTGTVKDDKGEPLPGVSVSAKNMDTGLERSDVTDDNGTYRIPSLPPGKYDITASITGFATQIQKGVNLYVGTTADIQFGMKLSTTSETMEISGETPLIESTESHIATVVTPEQVQNLPLNGRQFANLGALAPGTTLTVHPDPTRPSNLAVSLIGGSGRNMNVTVDGGDNNDDTVGGINQFYSLESVAEFTILTNRYKAEYGRSSGGVLNVVTKSGTNDPHGSFFSLFRDDSLNAITTSEKDAGVDKAPYSRKQYGGSFGGPIVKDRAHFFVAAERSQTDQQSLVDLADTAPELNGFDPLPTRDTLFTGKFTSNLSPEQYLTVRYGQQKTTTIYGAAPNYAPDARGTLTNTFHSVLASHSYVLSENKLNEIAFQYADFQNAIRPTSDNPTEIFPNGVYLGQNINTPQTTTQKKYQFRDDFSWSMSEHHFKSGVNFVHEPTLGGTFTTGTVPQFTHLSNDRNSPITTININGGIFGDQTPNNQTGFYFQDDWNVNQKLTLNLGLRYDVVTGLSIDQSSSQLFQDLHNSQFNFSWLAPFQNSANGTITMDKNNFQPRLGAAYDLKGDGTTVIRGGWGLYYDFPYTNANLLFPLAALGGFGSVYAVNDPNGIRNPDGSLFHIGDPLPPSQTPGATLPNDVLSPDWKIPYTNQASVGFSHELGQSGAMDVDYIHVAVRDQYVRFKFNGVPTPGGTRMLPNFGGGPRLYAPLGFSDYNGLNLSYRHRLTKGIQLQGSYTLSKVEGNLLPGSDEFRLGSPSICTHCALDFKLGPKDDPRMTGPLTTDARHRIVIAGTFDLPAEFRVSGFFRARSGQPYNAFLATDANGDGLRYDTTDPHVNSRRGPSFSQLDVRVSKVFNIKMVRLEGILEAFNLFNAKNPAGNRQGGNEINGVIGTPAFGTANVFAGDAGQGEQRLAQLGFRIEF